MKEKPKPFIVDLPFTGETWQHFYSGSSVGLTVPNDSRLLALAKKWAAAPDDDPFKPSGVDILQRIAAEKAK